MAIIDRRVFLSGFSYAKIKQRSGNVFPNFMEQKQIQIKAKDEDLKGAYSNLAIISHTKEEFCLDFVNTFPPTPILMARVLMTPTHLKRLIGALQENMRKYEDQFGRVEPGKEPEASIGFKPLS